MGTGTGVAQDARVFSLNMGQGGVLGAERGVGAA